MPYMRSERGCPSVVSPGEPAGLRLSPADAAWPSDPVPGPGRPRWHATRGTARHGSRWHATPPSVRRWQPCRLARAFGRHGLAEGRADDYRRVIATGPVFVESVRYRRRRTAWVAAGVVAAGGMVDVLEVGVVVPVGMLAAVAATGTAIEARRRLLVASRSHCFLAGVACRLRTRWRMPCRRSPRWQCRPCQVPAGSSGLGGRCRRGGGSTGALHWCVRWGGSAVGRGTAAAEPVPVPESDSALAKMLPLWDRSSADVVRGRDGAGSQPAGGTTAPALSRP